MKLKPLEAVFFVGIILGLGVYAWIAGASGEWPGAAQWHRWQEHQPSGECRQ